MSEIIFEVIKIVVMVAALLVTRYLVPWIKEKIGADKLAVAEKWAKYAVLKAQQVMYEENGQERKAYVTEFLKEILLAKNISLSDEQVDVLIEAAVKQMKIEENAGTVNTIIQSTDNSSVSEN
jgi:LL-H family phage holin